MSIRHLLWRVDAHGIKVEWSRDYGDDVECRVSGQRSPVGFGLTWASALEDLLRRLQ